MNNNQNNQVYEMENVKNSEDFQKKLRVAFVRKVYGILLAQCALTTFLCLLSMSTKFGTFQKENLWLLILTIVLSFMLIIILSCCQKTARKVPGNYILLYSFTFCEAYLVSYICIGYSANTVLSAAALTTAAVIGLTIYAFYTKTDFTFLGGFLFVFLLVFFVFGIILIFVKIKVLYLIYCAIGVLLFSIYLIFDTQLVIGRFEKSYSLDDYIFAALNLYLDIINIFLYILSFLGEN